MVHQLLYNFQKLNYLRLYSQEDLLYMKLLDHYLKQCKLLWLKLLGINQKNFSKKEKIFDTIKTVDNSVKDIKVDFGAGIILTNNKKKML